MNQPPNARRPWLAVCVLLIAILNCSIPPESPPSADFYVSVKGSDITGDGSQAKPWRHIQYAIDHAKQPAGSVLTIHLLKGIYVEKLVIKRPLALKGIGVGPISTWASDPEMPVQDISAISPDISIEAPRILIQDATSVSLHDLVIQYGGVRVVNTRLNMYNVEVQNSRGLYGVKIENSFFFYIEKSKIMTAKSVYSDYALDIMGSDGELLKSYVGDYFDHAININPLASGEKINPYEFYQPPHVTIRDSEIAGSNIFYADGIRIQGPTNVRIYNTKITRTHSDNQAGSTGTYNKPHAGIEIGGWLVMGNPTVEVQGVTISGFDVGIGTTQEGFGLKVQSSNISGVTYAAQTSYYGYTNVAKPHIDFGGGYYNSPGMNTFGKGGLYAFYNDVPYDVDACYNNWSVALDQIDPQRIFDKLDNSGKGRVKWNCPQADVIPPPTQAKLTPTLSRIILTPTFTLTPSDMTAVVLKDDLCYQGPGDKYEVVSALRAGTNVSLIGLGEGGQYFVVLNPIYKDPCWVARRSLNFPGDVNTLRIIPIPTLPVLVILTTTP